MGAMRPINRLKHVVDKSAALAAAVSIGEIIVLTSDTPALAATSTVETGSKVNGIYLRVEVVSNEDEVPGAVPNVYMAIQKNPGGTNAVIQANSVGGNAQKRFIIHQEMTMIQNGNAGNPRTLFNGVIVIPKGYKRMGPLDTITVNIFSPAVDIVYCIQAHFKEFR